MTTGQNTCRWYIQRDGRHYSECGHKGLSPHLGSVLSAMHYCGFCGAKLLTAGSGTVAGKLEVRG